MTKDFNRKVLSKEKKGFLSERQVASILNILKV